MQLNRKIRIYVAFVSALIICLSCFNFSAVAAESTLGTQAPAITATYTDMNGNAADGNELTSGTYQMALTVSDLSSISVLEFTSTYDASILSFGEYTMLSSSMPELETVGDTVITSNGRFIFCLVSTNAETSYLTDNSATLITIEITITTDSPVDMDNVIQVSQSPDLTYIDVHYADRSQADGVYTHNCYALSKTDNFRGEVYAMSCDLSPEVSKGYSVSAYVGALAAPTDSYGTYATTGAEVSITLADNSVISAVTDNDGKFVLENVPNGTYTATITYKYGFTRTFTIVVNGADVESTTMVGIVGCNWDGNTAVNVSDVNVYSSYLNVRDTDPSYDLGIDIDRNNVINVSDLNVYSNFINQSASSMTYDDTVIS